MFPKNIISIFIFSTSPDNPDKSAKVEEKRPMLQGVIAHFTHDRGISVAVGGTVTLQIINVLFEKDIINPIRPYFRLILTPGDFPWACKLFCSLTT